MRERGTEVARMVASDGAKTFEEFWATETGLLDVRAVKLAVGGGMSLVFGLAAERELLARVPIERLRVVGSVAALLDDL